MKNVTELFLLIAELIQYLFCYLHLVSVFPLLVVCPCL